MYKKSGSKKITVFITIFALVSLACQATNSLPFFATPTPTVTNTPTLTSTPTVTITPSPSPTSTPLPSGVHMEKQADGNSVFIDYDNKFKLMLPEVWIVIPFEKENFDEAVAKLGEENPQFKDVAENFKNADPELFRMFALNSNPDFIGKGVSNISISAVEDKLLSTMPISFVTGVLESQLEKEGFKVTTQGVNVSENAHGVEVEYIELEHSVNGEKLVQRIIVFQTNNKLIMITITLQKQFSVEILKDADIIAKSIELMK